MNNKNVIDAFLKEIEHIRFENVNELYRKKEKIKADYSKLDIKFKEMYKWYFFNQLCVNSISLKRAFWYYVNDENGDSDMIIKEYNKFLNKNKKNKENESKNSEI